MDQFEKLIISTTTYQEAGQAFAEARMPRRGVGNVLISMPIDVFNVLYTAWNEPKPVEVGMLR